jgi:serine/threonine protein phosphatase 1
LPHRTIAIGDVHGCSRALAAVIEAIDPGPEDVLVFLGDYIDRGPDTRGVVELVIGLRRRCRLVPLLGNHEDLLLGVLADRHPLPWLLGIGGNETLDSYGVGRALHLIPEDHLEFFESCLDYYETPTHIFLHANYDPDLPLDQQPWPRLRWESLRSVIPGPHRSGKTVILGHTSQKDGRVLDLGHLKCIDTFCYGGGWLTAIDVDTSRIWQADQEGRLRPS